jgi:hypothetical protein
MSLFHYLLLLNEIGNTYYVEIQTHLNLHCGERSERYIYNPVGQTCDLSHHDG